MARQQKPPASSHVSHPALYAGQTSGICFLYRPPATWSGLVQSGRQRVLSVAPHTTHRAGPQWAVQQVGTLDEVLPALALAEVCAFRQRSFMLSKPCAPNHAFDKAWCTTGVLDICQ